MPTVPDDSGVQVSVKHDFNEIFERNKFDCNFLVKVSCIIFVNPLFKLQSHNFF